VQLDNNSVFFMNRAGTDPKGLDEPHADVRDDNFLYLQWYSRSTFAA
jgi:hypothetical protein